MVAVDRHRCGYCGGCVSVCPIGAIELAETRLLIDESCTDCGLCLNVCPAGALRQTRWSSGVPLQERYDLVVVGAGPAGSTAARETAQSGLSVLLMEKRQEIGSPVRCAEGVGRQPLEAFIEPDEHWIAATVERAQFTTVANGVEETRRLSGGQGYILERRIFDRLLAEEAAKAGTMVAVKTAAQGLLIEDGAVRGVIAAGPRARMEIEAQIVIGADGVESRVGSWAGLETTLPLRDTMSCAQYLLAGINVDPACCCYYIGLEVAPGGYAWIFPKGEGKANVGLGVQADLATEPALAYLDRFVESRPHLAQGSPVTLVMGSVPVALPPPRLVANGLMLVGDAARQVDPLTGGGITNAMAAGRLAAQVAIEAIDNGDTSAAFLSEYEKRWKADLGRKMARNYRLRQRFSPAQYTSRGFMRAFTLAAAGG